MDSAFESISYKAAPGSDGLSASIIKECFPVYKVHLLFIVRECINFQFFPKAWKSSEVLIIGKPNKPSYNALDSFRPISLVKNIAKVLERIVLNRLQCHSSSANWLSPNQRDFTSGRSTETATESALLVSTSDGKTNLFAMHRTLVHTARTLKSHEHVEIISSSPKRLSFLNLGKLVSRIQLNCLDTMVSIRRNTSFCVVHDLLSSYGLCLTRAICESSDIRDPILELRHPKKVAVVVASTLTKSLHQRE